MSASAMLSYLNSIVDIQLCCVQPIEEKKDMFKGKNVDMNILK